MTADLVAETAAALGLELQPWQRRWLEFLEAARAQRPSCVECATFASALAGAEANVARLCRLLSATRFPVAVARYSWALHLARLARVRTANAFAAHRTSVHPRAT